MYQSFVPKCQRTVFLLFIFVLLCSLYSFSAHARIDDSRKKQFKVFDHVDPPTGAVKKDRSDIPPAPPKKFGEGGKKQAPKLSGLNFDAQGRLRNGDKILERKNGDLDPLFCFEGQQIANDLKIDKATRATDLQLMKASRGIEMTSPFISEGDQLAPGCAVQLSRNFNISDQLLRSIDLVKAQLNLEKKIESLPSSNAKFAINGILYTPSMIDTLIKQVDQITKDTKLTEATMTDADLEKAKLEVHDTMKDVLVTIERLLKGKTDFVKKVEEETAEKIKAANDDPNRIAKAKEEAKQKVEKFLNEPTKKNGKTYPSFNQLLAQQQALKVKMQPHLKDSNFNSNKSQFPQHKRALSNLLKLKDQLVARKTQLQLRRQALGDDPNGDGDPGGDEDIPPPPPPGEDIPDGGEDIPPGGDEFPEGGDGLGGGEGGVPGGGGADGPGGGKKLGNGNKNKGNNGRGPKQKRGPNKEGGEKKTEPEKGGGGGGGSGGGGQVQQPKPAKQPKYGPYKAVKVPPAQKSLQIPKFQPAKCQVCKEIAERPAPTNNSEAIAKQTAELLVRTSTNNAPFFGGRSALQSSDSGRRLRTRRALRRDRRGPSSLDQTVANLNQFRNRNRRPRLRRAPRARTFKRSFVRDDTYSSPRRRGGLEGFSSSPRRNGTKARKQNPPLLKGLFR